MKFPFLLVSLICFSLSLLNAQDVTYNKFGKGLRVIAKDSSFSMKFSARFQTLYEGYYTPKTEQYEEQMSIRRWRLKFDGFAYSPKLVYKIEIGLSNRDIGNDDQPRIILDAVLKYHFNKNWELWFGQTKLPGNRERVISSQKLQFVDRSLVNSRFNLDRDIGVQLHHRNKLGKSVFNQIVSVSSGEGRNYTERNAGGHDFTGRFEWLPFGEFTDGGDYFCSDLKRELKPKLSIGATYDLNQNTIKQRGQLGIIVGDSIGNRIHNDLQALIVDAIFKYKGLSIMSEYVKKDGEDGIKGFGTGEGLVFQSGYLFKNNFEIAGRYTEINPLKTQLSSLTKEKEYTLGVSKYIVGHSLKLQSDLSLTESLGKDDVIRYRFHIELSF